MIDVVEPSKTVDLDAVWQLMRDFIAWHRRTNVADIDLIDRYFEADAFEAELAGLPGGYGPPRGMLLLARSGGRPAGCVALHDLGSGECEMKRMFVPEAFRGAGIGHGDRRSGPRIWL